MPADEPRYRIADLELFPAGPDQTLVYARDGRSSGFYRAEQLELLAGCQRFQTLDEHAARYQGRSGIRRELTRLARAGLLVPEPNFATPPVETQLPVLDTIGLISCRRPELLHRAVTSYAGNCAEFGRRVQFAVSDDSADAGEGNRSMLAERAQALKVEISYADRTMRAGYLTELAAASDLPIELLRFGCLGEVPGSEPTSTIGANRNSLLLQLIGRRFVAVDDDTVGLVGLAPEHRAAMAVADGNPLQLWFYPDRAAALAAVGQPQDLLGAHDRYLGRSVGQVLYQEPIELDRADPAVLRRLAVGAGRIRVTANGTAGDCGWDNPDFHLFQQAETHRRLVASEAGYRQARASRNLVQASPRPVLTGQPDPRFGMCMGLDNTALLPPFPPTGRAEEVSFASLLARCEPAAFGMQLPLLIQHDPAGDRRFTDRPPFTLELGSWLPAALDRCDPGLATTAAQRLEQIGRFVSDLGRLAPDSFDEFVEFTVWQSMSVLIEQLQQRLDDQPAYWRTDALRYLGAVRQNALLAPAERYLAVDGRAAFQQLLVRYGQLLQGWPRILAFAAQLQAAGYGLGRPL